jgi:cysteine desulfurase
MSWDASRIGGLRDQFLGRLSDQVDGISINGSMDFRLPGNLNIAIAGIDADSLIARLPDVAISTGSACNSGALESSHVLRAMGLDQETLDGSVRIGIGRTSTSDEVDYAVCRLVTEIKYLRRAAKVPAESRTGEAAVPIRMRKTTSAPRKVRRRAGGR